MKGDRVIKKFEPPRIVGFISEDTIEVPRSLSRIISKLTHPTQVLPFKVEARHLKNVLLCMELMDIAAIVVEGRHAKRIYRHLKRLDPSAKAGKRVDMILRDKKGLIGFDLEAPSFLKAKAKKEPSHFYLKCVELLTSV